MAPTPGQAKEERLREGVVTAFVDFCEYKWRHEIGYTARDRGLRDTVLLALESIGRFDDSPWRPRWYKLAYKMYISLFFQPIVVCVRLV